MLLECLASVDLAEVEFADGVMPRGADDGFVEIIAPVRSNLGNGSIVYQFAVVAAAASRANRGMLGGELKKVRVDVSQNMRRVAHAATSLQPAPSRSLAPFLLVLRVPSITPAAPLDMR